MRFRSVPQYVVVLLMMATYVVYLGATEQLTLYIHPRYVLFTLVMAAIGLLLTLLNTYFGAEEDHHRTSRLARVPLGLMLAFAVVLPARTLTSATVSQRTTDAGSIVSASDSKPLNTLFAGSSKGLNITDWARLLSINEDPGYYTNKPAKISGFVHDAGLGNDTIWLARFVLTCCAVDAQPAGVPVRLANWPAQYEKDEWLEIEGEFALALTADGRQLVLIPENVTKIEQPSNPYAN